MTDFGLRERMIRLHRDLTHPVLFNVNTAVLIGRSGRMFYEGNEMVRKARASFCETRDRATARLIAEMRDALAERGAQLSGGHSAELVHHLSGRPSSLGSGQRQKDGIRSPAQELSVTALRPST